MLKCPNCSQNAEITKDWACRWCGYPLISKAFAEEKARQEAIEAKEKAKQEAIEAKEKAKQEADLPPKNWSSNNKSKCK